MGIPPCLFSSLIAWNIDISLDFLKKNVCKKAWRMVKWTCPEGQGTQALLSWNETGRDGWEVDMPCGISSQDID